MEVSREKPKKTGEKRRRKEDREVSFTRKKMEREETVDKVFFVFLKMSEFLKPLRKKKSQ